MKLRLEQDKICKNSIRYSASKQALHAAGVVNQPFTIYVPNALLPKDNPPKKITITLDLE